MAKFVPRQRKQKNKQKESRAPPVDTNATEVQPISKGEKESRRQALRDELRAQHTKVSGKKQKRLDKYIVRGWIVMRLDSNYQLAFFFFFFCPMN